MADRRRLQGEIDKTLKKINEGVETFDDVWQKLVFIQGIQVQTATNLNQKEKYESELKKEIKKLQRLREQIKAWQSSNDIKDKKPLLEARKNIEQQMERFKVIERETKQKPYSKDALGGSGGVGGAGGSSGPYKYDPLEKEKEEIDEWIQSSNSKLNTQIEDLDSKLQDLNGNKKKRLDKEKIELTKQRLETHKKYVDTLERISNMVKKNLISVKKVQEIKDDVDFYIDNNDQADFPSNMDNLDIFDELELDKYDSSALDDDDDEEDDDDDDEDDGEENDHERDDENDVHDEEEHIHEDEHANENGHDLKTNSNTNNNNNNNNNTSSPSVNNSNNKANLNSNPINNNQYISSSSSSTSSTSSTTSTLTNSSNDSNQNSKNNERRRHKSDQNENMNNNDSNESRNNNNRNKRNNYNNSNSNNSNNSSSNRNRANSGTSMPNNNNSYNKISSPSTNNVNTTTSNLTPPPASQSPFSNSTIQPQVSFSAALANNKSNSQQNQKQAYSSQVKSGLSTNDNSNNKNNNTQTTGTTTNTSPSSTSSSNINNNSTSIDNNNKLPNEYPMTLKEITENVILTSNSNTNSIKNNHPDINLLQQSTYQPKNNGNNNANLLIENTNTNGDPNLAALAAALMQQQQQNKLNIPVGFNNSQNSATSTSTMPPSTANSNSAVSPSLQQQQQYSSTNQETFIQPILGVAPLGKSPLTKEQTHQLAILDGAFKKLPQPSDTERPRAYFPRIQVNTPSYYPMTPPSGHDSLDFLCKLHSDTLFFMFYYMEGTKAQFLAAQALKRLSWRYHTRYMMWFQRYEEPKIITDEYETGTYVLFDFEKWQSRRKEDFTFEYKYLEDRDLSIYQ